MLFVIRYLQISWDQSLALVCCDNNTLTKRFFFLPPLFTMPFTSPLSFAIPSSPPLLCHSSPFLTFFSYSPFFPSLSPSFLPFSTPLPPPFLTLSPLLYLYFLPLPKTSFRYSYRTRDRPCVCTILSPTEATSQGQIKTVR